MKTTRTYIISLRKIASYFLITVLSFLLILSAFFSLKKEEFLDKIISYPLNKSIISENFPLVFDYTNKENNISFVKVLSILLNEDISNPGAIFSDKISFIHSVKSYLQSEYLNIDESNNYYLPKIIKEFFESSKKDSENIKYNPATETTVKSINENGNYLDKKGIRIDNKTSYNINLDSLYNEDFFIKNTDGLPQVLIVHTHGSESYNPTDRSEDVNKNIVLVGKEMKNIFSENGINVIHSEKMHDIPKFNNSYKNSLETINYYLDKYPSINIVLDIHRDAMITDKGEVFKVVNTFNDVKASQVMFVVGTNSGGLKHDNWKTNLKFAIHCQERLNALFPNIARPINIRGERFNQHATNGSLIIEIGTNGNTMEESLISGKITAQAISDVIKNFTK
ncbi:MAG: hypothetical protein E7405_04045 [Ruminococcaceae bacterium]|nr:hypothetical protein [Oscillospiraceae bacterium]